jgi:hypothetical protein
MITKENAEKTLKSGTVLDVSVVFSLRAAVYQQGAAAAYMTAQVCGLKYPSGICISIISFYLSGQANVLSVVHPSGTGRSYPLEEVSDLPAIP